jgi:hypothetical protein
MRCRRVESPATHRFAAILCDEPANKNSEFRTQGLVIHDIVFNLLEIVACRSYGFCFVHFIMLYFSSHIRENSRALKPHPPLTRSPFPDHGEGFWESGPLPGMPPASRAYAPPRAEKAFSRFPAGDATDILRCAPRSWGMLLYISFGIVVVHTMIIPAREPSSSFFFTKKQSDPKVTLFLMGAFRYSPFC